MDERFGEIFWCRKFWIGGKITNIWEAVSVRSRKASPEGLPRSAWRSEYNLISL